MNWPYEIITDLTAEDKAARRESLDASARYAHYSAFVPAAIYLLYRLGSSVLGTSRRSANYEPISPSARNRRGASGVAATWRRVRWWLSEPVSKTGHRGHRDEWVFGTAWALWLLYLSITGTGTDYAHVTKRFGLIAASQLPIQTLLSLKALNPFAHAFRASHESVNRFHRALGRVIYLFLALHVLNYFNLLYRNGNLLDRIFDNVVLPGELANMAYTALFATALPKVREYSYRVFFVVHLLVVFATSFLLFIHAEPARFYIVEALLVFVLDLAVRKMSTATAQSRIEAVPGTNLIKISAKLSPRKITQFAERPGSHAYISIPWPSRPRALSSLVYEFCFNPFTVAEVNRDAVEVVLVARQQGGPMTRRLMQLTREDTGARVPLAIEGPFGAFATTYSNLVESGVDRVLLVAGGVGASFVLPAYKALRESIPSAKVELTWAVRLADDASWASFSETAAVSGGTNVLNDPNVHIYVSGKHNASMPDYDSDRLESRSSSVEMQSLGTSGEAPGAGNRPYVRGRPNLKGVVDEVFKDEDAGSRVAVLVCGPREMALGVRESVTPWVVRGRDVVWHSESFGW